MSDTPVLDSRTAKILPWVIAIAFFMQMLDGTALNTALPSMAVDLQTTPIHMQSVVISYALTLAFLIPASGWIADRFGMKRVFMFAMALFTASSVACGLARRGSRVRVPSAPPNQIPYVEKRMGFLS